MRLRMKRDFNIIIILSLLFTNICLANFENQPSVSSFGMGGVLPIGMFSPSVVGLNPSILSIIPKKMFEVSYSRYYCDANSILLSSGFTGYVMPMDDFGCIGVNATFDFGGTSKELITTISYSNSFISPGRLSLGVGFDIYTRFLRVAENNSNYCQSFGVNGGVLIRPIDEILLGLSTTNINRPKLAFGNIKELPLKARLDIGAYIYTIRPCFSVNFIRDFEANTHKISYDFGIEAGLLGDKMKLRAGYNDNFSGGFGLTFQRGGTDFAFDYAFQLPLGTERIKNPSGNHKVGVSFMFGGELGKYKSSEMLETYRLNFNDDLIREISVKTGKNNKNNMLISVKGEVKDDFSSDEETNVGREVIYGSVNMISNLDPYDIANARVIVRVKKGWLDEICSRHDNIRFHIVSDNGEYLLDYIPTIGYSDDAYYYFESNVELIAPMVITAFIEPRKKEIVQPEEVAMLERPEVKEKPEGVWPRHHTVIKGECLFIIAGFEYHDPFKWRKIYEANRDKIRDPHWIYPGQVFIIPSPN
ncbi:MAG: hypothetical protein ACUVWP_06010 [bacterium]